LAGENSPSHASVDGVSLAATLDVDETRYTQLQKQIKAAVQTLNIADAADQHAEMATPEAAANALTEFESLGRVLFTQAVPPVIQQQIRLLPSASLLEIVSNDLNFPWELLHDGQGFLCVRLCVTRLPLLDQPPKQHILPSAKSKVSCLLLGNPTADLIAAEEEIHTIEDLLYSVHDRVHYDSYFGKMVTSSLLQELLASQKYDLVQHRLPCSPRGIAAGGWLAGCQSALRRPAKSPDHCPQCLFIDPGAAIHRRTLGTHPESALLRHSTHPKWRIDCDRHDVAHSRPGNPALVQGILWPTDYGYADC